MESQYKDSSNGVTNGEDEEYVAVANKRKMVGWGLFLRAAAAALSLAAAVVLGLDKQTTMVALPTLPPAIVSATARWHYLSAFVYLVVANAIASVYGGISLLLTILASKRGGKRKIVAMIVVFDLVMTALLFSSFGAGAAVGLIGRQGNSHVQWRKVCDVFEKFCVQGAVALLLSAGAEFMFFMLVAIAILNLHNKN